MSMRCCVAAILLVLMPLPAWAQFTLGAGIEYFTWTEDTSPIQVKERGPMALFTIGYTQVRAKGWLFAYRGDVYAGAVDYNGALLFAPSVPVSSTTNYLGSANEGQLRYTLDRLSCTTSCDDALAHLHE